MSATWDAAGLHVEPLFSAHPLDLRRDLSLRAQARGAVLSPELCRSLHSWLSWWLGEIPDPADPDEVRVAVDEAREALRQRSVEACSEDFRSGLAWADYWLDRIAVAAGETT